MAEAKDKMLDAGNIKDIEDLKQKVITVDNLVKELEEGNEDR